MRETQQEFVIVGHGHAGSKYSEALEFLEQSARIVDPALESIGARGARPQILHSIPTPIGSDDVAILATHASQRKSTLVESLSQGFRVFILEKLVATSLEDLNAIEREMDEAGAKGLVHNRWNLLNLNVTLRGLNQRLNLGQMLSFEVSGGNYCLVAGGHHLLALYLSLTGYEQKITSSNVDFGPSPRGTQLRTLHGQFTLRSSDGVTASFTAKKHGFLSPLVCINYESGRVIWDGLSCNVSYVSDVGGRQYCSPSLSETVELPSDNPFLIAIQKTIRQHQDSELELGISTSRLLLKIMTLQFGGNDSTQFPVT